MNTLLLSDFIVHHALMAPGASASFKETSVNYFVLKDDATLIYYNVNDGIAPHKNDSTLQVRVINYEAFHNTLPHNFRQGKKICDLIVYTSQVNNYFSLNELTDTVAERVVPFVDLGGNQFQGKRNKAMEQLRNTLTLLNVVPEINAFMSKYTVRRCCFFNKPATPPVTPTVTITAPTSFGRINTLTEEGFEMSYNAINSLGFELYEYSGGKSANII